MTKSTIKKEEIATGGLRFVTPSSSDCRPFPVSVTHFRSFQFQFLILSHPPQALVSSTHLAVVVGHGEQSNGAVGVAAVADRRHVSVPHDWHAGQRLARGVRVRDGVALPGRRGQLGAQREVLLDLLVLALVEVEFGVLQVALYLWQEADAPVR